MMIAIPLFVLLLSKINCHVVSPNPQLPGMLQAPLFRTQEPSLPSAIPTSFGFDNALLPPNNRIRQEFKGSPEFQPAAPMNPREFIANLRSQLTQSQSISNMPAKFEESVGNYDRKGGFQPDKSLNEIGSILGVNLMPGKGEAGTRNTHATIGFNPYPPQPYSQQPVPQTRSIFPSEFKSSPHTNIPEKQFKNPIAASNTQAFRPTNPLGLQNSQYIHKNQHSPLNPTLTGQSTMDPFLSSLTASIPSPIIPSSPSKRPRPIIPSPLSLTDPISSSYSSDDPINSFDQSDSILTSTVGCLELTVTPYGTISETPLPDPSIPLPRGPFLPIASPVSALAPPFSPLLPSAMPNAKSNYFLNKVPVPPPFI